MKVQDLKNKKILILGLGREGVAALNFLKKQFPDKKIDIADLNYVTDLPDNVGQKFLGEEYLTDLNKYEVIIKSPGIPYSKEISEAKINGVEITSITKLFFDNFPGKIVGVTGTKGKSTTASLIYQILKTGGLNVDLVGNIGKPALEILDKTTADSIAVYELSSFQLEDLDQSPHVSVITNIYPEHLDHHGNLAAYIEAKMNITKYQTEGDYLVFNREIPELQRLVKQTKAKLLAFPTDHLEIQDLIDESKLLLKGEYNLKNIQAARLAGEIFNISVEKIKEAIENFSPLPHRLEFVGEFNGIRFYNDSLSTIPQALIAAIDTLGDDVETLIAGGFDRGIDYKILGSVIAKSGIKNLILFPTTGAKIWFSLASHIGSGKAKIGKFDINNMVDAVKIAYEVTSPGKIVLLSPAATSFNLFKDYADRGNQFKDNVKKLSDN